MVVVVVVVVNVVDVVDVVLVDVVVVVVVKFIAIAPQRKAHPQNIPLTPIIIPSVGVFENMHSCSSEQYWVGYYPKGVFLAKTRQQISLNQRLYHKGTLMQRTYH